MADEWSWLEGVSTTWWVAEEYELIEENDEFRVAPASDNFHTYDPVERFLNEPDESPHLKLAQLEDPADPKSVLNFVEDFGLLGSVLRWDLIEGAKTYGDTWVHSWNVYEDRTSPTPTEQNGPPDSASQGVMKGAVYFRDCFMKPPSSVPFSRKPSEEFWKVYSESIQPEASNEGRLQSSSPDWDEPWGGSRRYEEKRGLWWAHSFTQPALSYQLTLEEYPDALKDRLKVSLTGQDEKIGLRAHSLLDMCFILNILDSAQIAICPQCLEKFRKTSGGSRYCSTGPGSCSEYAGRRKTKQAKDWLEYLEVNHEELFQKWSRVRQHGTKRSSKRIRTPDHPIEHLTDLTQNESRIAKEWAQSHQSDGRTRDVDEFIDPILEA